MKYSLKLKKLPPAISCEYMASNSERIMEKSRNFQIVYVNSLDVEGTVAQTF